ncbi:CoA transferase [Williamsia sp. R60]
MCTTTTLTRWCVHSPRSAASTQGGEDRPGYDPIVQAVTGIMSRFGGADTPALHGLAATVDYLTGYSAAFWVCVGLLARRTGSTDVIAHIAGPRGHLDPVPVPVPLRHLRRTHHPER